MPLYFVLSGLFFKDYGGIYNFMEKKINKLLIPFIFFFALGLMYHWIHFREFGYGVLLDPLLTNKMVNLPIWFLISLFWINLMYCVINICARSVIMKGVLVFMFGTAGYIASFNDIYLPFFLCSAFTALPFFYIGVLIRKLPLLYPNKHSFYELVAGILILSVGFGYAIIYDTPHVLFRSNRFVGDLLVVYIFSISLVIGLLLLCKHIKWLPIVSYIGRYSIVMLGLHGLVITIMFSNDIKLEPIMVFCITVTLCWLAIPFMIRYLPKFTAQKDLIRLPCLKQKVETVGAKNK